MFRLRFQIGMGQAEGLKKYRNLKKDRARLLTVLTEKHAAGVTSEAPAGAVKKSKKK
jgi:large subunit ribosomal protein L29